MNATIRVCMCVCVTVCECAREHLNFCTWRRWNNAFGIKIYTQKRYNGNNLWLLLRVRTHITRTYAYIRYTNTYTQRQAGEQRQRRQYIKQWSISKRHRRHHRYTNSDTRKCGDTLNILPFWPFIINLCWKTKRKFTPKKKCRFVVVAAYEKKKFFPKIVFNYLASLKWMNVW